MNSRARYFIVSLLVCSSVLLQSCVVPLQNAPASLASNASPNAIAGIPQSGARPDLLKAKDDVAQASYKPPAQTGALVWPVELDADRDDATNPLPGRSVPVLRMRFPTLNADHLFTQVDLGVEVKPANANSNPAGVVVDFHLWTDDHALDLHKFAAADEWGAALAEIPLSGDAIHGAIHYRATAYGFGESIERAFTLDANRSLADTSFGTVSATANVASDGKLSAALTSQTPIGAGEGDAQFLLFKYSFDETAPDHTRREMLPELVAKRRDANHAGVEIYLEAGDYVLIPQARNGNSKSLGMAVPVRISTATLPKPVRIERALGYNENSDLLLIEYRGAQGELARQAMTFEQAKAIPHDKPIADEDKPTVFQQVIRTKAFGYRTIVHTPKLAQVGGDGKKAVTIENMRFDPISRSYDIEVRSLMTQTVEDKVTLQALGPNNVVIYEQEMPVTLNPAEPAKINFVVPASRGDVKGLRIIVHDPFESLYEIAQEIWDNNFDVIAVISKRIKTQTDKFKSLPGFQLNPNVNDFSVTVFLEAGLTLLAIPLLTVNLTCSAGLQNAKLVPGGSFCFPVKFDGALLAGSATDLLMKIEMGLRAFAASLLVFQTDNPNAVDIEATLEKMALNGIELKSGGSLSLGLEFRLALDVLKAENCPSPSDFELAKGSFNRLLAELNLYAAEIQKLLPNQSLGSADTTVVEKFDMTVPFYPYVPVIKLKISAEFGLGILSISPTASSATSAGIQFKFLGPKFIVKTDFVVQPGFLLSIDILGLARTVSGAYDLLQAGFKARTLVERMLALKDITAIGRCTPGLGGGSGGGGGSAAPGSKGKKQAPLPAGFPDDRLDASQTSDAALPAGVSGDLQEARRHYDLALQLGYSRAAAYYLNRVRRLEFQLFQSDAAAARAEEDLIESRILAANTRLQGIISGTMPITPGVTITDAAGTELIAFYNSVLHTDYLDEQVRLQNAVNFAQRQYEGLLGQELELQIELDKLDSYGVGVLDDGLSNFALSAIATMGYEPTMIQLFAGTSGVTGLSKAVSPFAAPPVLLIPSGGLYPYEGNAAAKTWLEQYVAAGGTLIVLAQYENQDWQMLPGGQVRGLGYKDDILCKDNSVRLVNPSDFIVGIDQDLPNIQVDGSFTDFPANTTVVLMRTTGNQKPAMIEYGYGAGRVIATSAFPDFYINGMQSGDDIVFARSLFGVAFLKATGQQVAASAPVNGQVQFSTPITNTSIETATALTIYRDYYDARIGEGYRWAAHASTSRSTGTSLQLLNPPLAPGESRVVNLSFQASPVAGLFRAAVGLSHIARDFVYNFGPFIQLPLYQVRGAGVPIDLFNTSLQVDPNGYAFGAQATVTATLRNDRSTARTIVLSTEVGLPASVVTLTLQPNSLTQQTFTTGATSNKDVRIVVKENGDTISTLFGVVRVRRPSVFMQLNPNRVAPGLVTTLAISVAASDVPANTPVLVQVLNGASEIYSSTQPLAQIGADHPIVFSTPLPAFAPNAPLKVRATLQAAVCAVLACVNEQMLPVGKAHEVIEFLVTSPLTLGETSPNALYAFLSGNGFDTSARLHSEFSIDGNAPTTGPEKTLQTAALIGNANVDVALPAIIPVNKPLTLKIVDNSMSAGASATYTTERSVRFTLAMGSASLDDVQQRTRNTARGTLPAINVFSNDGFAPDVRLPQGTTYSLTIQTPENSVLNFTGALTYRNGRHEFAFDLPSLQQGGTYVADFRVPALGEDYRSAFSFYVSPQHLLLQAPATAQAGAAINLNVRNTGGVDTFINGRLTLQPAGELPIASVDGISVSVASGGSTPLAYTLPSQLASGPYVVQVAGVDHLNQPVTITARIDVSGVNAMLDARTDRFAYLAVDPVSTHDLINTNVPLDGATLRLRVVKPAGSPAPANGEDWLSDFANAGKINRSNNAIAPSTSSGLTPAWTAAHAAYLSNPLSVNGLIIVADTNNGKLRALNSANGQIAWETDYTSINFGLYGYAANSSKVFLLFQHQLSALDVTNGNVLWTISTAGNFQNPIYASDTSLAVYQSAGGGNSTQAPNKGMSGVAKPVPQIASVDGYILIDPATGAQRGIAGETATQNALLVNDTLIFIDANNSALNAVNATTGASVWSTPINNGYSLTPVAASAQVVVIHDGSDTTLKVFNFSSGALMQTIAVDSGFYPYTRQSAILSGNALVYESNQYTVNGNVVTLFHVNLANGAQSAIFSDTISFAGMTEAGDKLIVLQSYPQPQTARILNSAGAQQSAIDLSSLNGLYGVMVSRQGLIFGSSDGIAAYSATAGGGSATSDAVIFETTATVNGNGAIQLDVPLTNLNTNPQARGALVLDGALFSKEPASESNLSKHVLLAGSRYGFVIEDASSALVIAAQQSVAHANRAGYAPDDAISVVTLSGEARNTSPLASDIAVTVTRSDNAVVFAQTFAAVAAGASVSFTVTDASAPIGTIRYNAESDLGGAASAQVQVNAGNVTAAGQLDATDLILGQSLNLNLTLQNTLADVQGVVTVDWGDGASETFTLDPAQTLNLSHVYTPSVAGSFAPNVTLTGDASGAVSVAPAQVRDESASSTAALQGKSRGSAIVRTAAAALSFTVSNTHPYSVPVVIDYVVNSNPITGSQLMALAPNSAQTLTIPLKAFDAGNHTAIFTVTHAQTGNVLGVVNQAFALVDPIITLQLQTSAGAADADGNVPIYITLSSDAMSDEPIAGALVLSGALDARLPFSLLPGQSLAITPTFSLNGRSGVQVVNVLAVNAQGQIAGQSAVQVQAAPRPAPNAKLISLSADPANAGGSVTLRATVRNDGDDGDVSIDFNAFENSTTTMATIPANTTREVSATLPVPAGILQGTYPSFAELDSQQANADVAVTAPSIALDLSLDKRGYPANTNGVIHAQLRGISGASQPYDVAFRYRTGETLQTITLGAGDNRDVMWTFDAGQTSDRLTVIVSNHTSDATTPRYNIAIDSIYVNVIDDDRAWIESDKRSYNAGDVVHLTLHATKPLQDAIVLAPNDMPGAGKYILWNDLEVLSATGVLTNVIGTFNIDYALPAVVPTGRYAFTLQYNGESRSFPIDVHGITAQVEDFAIVKGAATAAGIPLTLSANVRSNAGVPNARVSAYAVAPDGSIMQLGSGADRTLALGQGLTPVQLDGVLNGVLPGAYRVILRVFEAGSYTQLAGASGFVQAGSAAILALNTDHGVYAPNQPAQGSIGVYGIDSAANIKVATSSGNVLLNSTRALTGFAQINFNVPTSALGDEVLIGTVTGSDGMTSSLQTPYRVAASFDVTVPAITILSPVGTPTQTALITLNGPASHNLNVNGTVNDASAIASVLVNGITATLTGNAFNATVPITVGLNFIDVMAKDIAGNIGFTSTTALALPVRGLTFTVAPAATYANQSVVYRAVLTASEDTTATVVIGENEGVIRFANASANGGAFAGAVANTRVITWSGAINANAPAQIVLTGTVIGNPPANGALTSTTNLTATFVGLDALTAQAKVSVGQAPTPTSTSTSTPTSTSTNTPTPTSTNTPTPTPTSTNTPTPTPTNTSTSTPMSTSTKTPTPTSTNTPSPTPTNTPAPSGNVDLSIQVSDGKQALLPGGVLIYAIAYANTSAITATNVRITETVPANTRFVLAQSVLGWSCANNSPAGSACVFNVGTLAPGARGSAVFAVLHNGATSPVVITDTVKIGSANGDVNLVNNTSSVGTPLILSGGTAITPLLECVIDRGASANPRYAAVFGYDNPNAFAKAQAIGSSNKFTPNPQDRGQPIAFLLGRQRNAFFVDFNSGSLTWTLGSKTASATTTSPKCATTTKIVSGVAFLDANGDGLRGSILQEPGLPLIVLNLVDASGAVIDTRVTALDGSYSFVVDNPAGKFVQVILSALLGLRFTTRDANAATKPGNDANDSAIDPATWRTLDLGTLLNPLQGTVNAGLRR